MKPLHSISLLSRLVIVTLCVVSLLDISWFGLQIYAWARMVQNRPSEVGFTEAVTNAVSGKDTCEWCQFIQTSRESERDEDSINWSDSRYGQPMCLSAWVRVLPARLIGRCHLFEKQDRWSPRKDAPPVPPPQVLARV